MTFYFDSLKIQTFTGINDNPVAPTPNKAGNGSHLVAQFNALVEQLKNSNGGSGNWLIKLENYTAQPNEQILALTYYGSFMIDLPSNPSLGNSVKLINATGNALYVNFNGGNYQGVENPQPITIFESSQEIVFIYVHPEIGWLSTYRTPTVETPPPSGEPQPQ